MDHKELQEKYNELTDKLNSFKMDKVKIQANLETLETKKETLESEIMELAKVDSIEKAKEKLDLVKQSLDDLIEKAEALLNDSE